ncbi:MAG: DUF2029 domain-containing protein [Kiritimatiellae bacterium]|nr:DUF2029 domain-containing protein [Kiritimatiellia bacterium]
MFWINLARCHTRRKTALAVVASGVLAFFVLFTVASCVCPVLEWGHEDAKLLNPPCDFSLRLAEVECLLRGVDPFDVWHGDVELAPYYPHNRPDLCRAGFDVPINAYVPWVYSLMTPFSLLPRRVAWAAYALLMFVCLGGVACGGFLAGRSLSGKRNDGVIAATVPLIMSFYPIWSNFCIGNLAVVVLAAITGMWLCLDRGRDVLAGCCWAVAMVKPQMAILLAVPLLLHRKFLSCLVAAGICLLLSVPPALICKTSVVKLIMEAPAAGVFAFNGCGTFPYFLCSGPGDARGVAIGLAVGLVACLAMSWCVRRSPSWLVRLMPAAVCSMCWTYAQAYTHALGYFMLLLVVLKLLSGRRDRIVLAVAAMSAIFLPRFYTCYSRLASIVGYAPPENLNLTLDSLNSTGSLLVCAMFCLDFCKPAARADPLPGTVFQEG